MTDKCPPRLGQLRKKDYPRRPTLLCGDPGSGKTLMAMEFIVKGISLFNENGVYLTFEESKNELYDNVASLGFDMDGFDAQQRIFIREIDLEMQEIVEIGKYSLEGLLSQLSYAIDTVNAKRSVMKIKLPQEDSTYSSIEDSRMAPMNFLS